MQIDPNYCPICREPNSCAMEIARTSGNKPEHCWCFDADFSADIMARVPDEAKGRACICQKCASETA
jgi:hypothetical protein